jgi:hypothetical protein
MSKRLAILAATTALVAVAMPAAAQDNYEAIAQTALRGGQAWADEAQAGVSWGDAASAVVADTSYGPDVAYEYESREVVQDTYEANEWQADDWDRDARPDGYHTARRAIPRERGPHRMDRNPAPRLAYSAAERDEWLAQCRALHAPQQATVYYEEEEDRDGGLIGGLIGGLFGGFAGNRIADGDRLLGTIVGAGVGGLAGAVIGSAIDRADDRDDPRMAYVEDDYGFDYCAAYLQNYERGHGTPSQVTYAPVMMVPVAQGAQRMEHRTSFRVIEEEVEVDARHPRPAPRQIRRAMPPREQGKTLRAN